MKEVKATIFREMWRKLEAVSASVAVSDDKVSTVS